MILKKLIANKFNNAHDILDRNVIEANNIDEIKKLFKWKETPVFQRSDAFCFEYIEDINERRVRDSEVLATVVCNVKSKTILEIGTSKGIGTVLMAKNSPKSHIYTINIPAEEIYAGQGGINTTVALKEEKIGMEYKKLGLTNVTQIYENTATWNPNIGEIDIAFIDGSHDSEFVFNDTVKVLQNMTSDGFIMWHDFNPYLRNKYYWIDDVCKGIEMLYRKKHLIGKIILLKDSWTGLYRVP
jgi:hypothetical protein